MEASVFDRNNYTEAEYFELFDKFDRKIEYHDGSIERMAGAPSAHNDIATNLLIALAKNAKKCKPHNSDQAVSIPAFKRYVYPDLSFSCGGAEFADDDKKRIFLLNPALVIEVISEESAERDEIRKFNWYFSIPTVKEYIVVHSLRKEVKSFLRKDKKTWIMQSLWEEEQLLSISTLGEELTLGKIYQGVLLLTGE